ncbi:Putative Mg2+ transporter protein, CorA-like/Zinc transport protein ZntB [Septoria linicola]|uniref:Mg2+ transporter protein, CorA-like/Zinc transport protein ZntB n=1 Tax=Septoria linicola TaxID=215465 RepID=A0A9Q9EN51_9PEZI|nr:Putative Mg2+ transporter protein, CorA-like/Zinc transport protein ZntB [Septoria linicola]
MRDLGHRSSLSSDEKASTSSSSITDSSNEWLEELRRYARRPPQKHLISGHHLSGLLDYVSQDTESRGPSLTSRLYRPSADDRSAFAVLYDFNEAQPEIKLECPTQLEHIVGKNAVAKHQSQLLFLQGHPSPAWIKAVGGAFGVDAQFFYHHLWRYSRKRDTARTWPPLPSRAVKESRYCLTTLGYLDDAGRDERQESHVMKLRHEAENHMAEYLQQVRYGKQHAELGDSLLRSLSVHDGANFSYEQYVSVWTEQTTKGWFALVLLDIGTTALRTCTPQDALKWLAPLGGIPGNTIFAPIVISDEVNMSLVRDSRLSNSKDEGVPQNAKHLCHGYHHYLDVELARKSSLHALQPLWTLISASEKQFLNMMRDLVKRDIREGRAAGDGQDDAALSNLMYNQDILEQHAERLNHNTRSFEKCNAWPVVHGLSHEDKAGIRAFGQRMLEDFGGLLGKAKHLESKCDQGAHRVTTLVSHAHSKKQLSQAERAEQLTRLGCFFLPMQYVASLFGMNFSQFGQGDLSVWLYFAITVPLISMMYVFVEPKARRLISGRVAQTRTLWKDRNQCTT